MPRRATALRTAPVDFSTDSSGVCTPTTTSPSGPFERTSDSIHGRDLRQLSHSNAQNSTITTLPLSAARVSGGELIQSSALACVNSGGLVGVAAANEPVASTANTMSLIPFMSAPL